MNVKKKHYEILLRIVELFFGQPWCYVIYDFCHTSVEECEK
jgi:hypothetical protein